MGNLRRLLVLLVVMARSCGATNDWIQFISRVEQLPIQYVPSLAQGISKKLFHVIYFELVGVYFLLVGIITMTPRFGNRLWMADSENEQDQMGFLRKLLFCVVAFARSVGQLLIGSTLFYE